jgi:hypothetical protein
MKLFEISFILLCLSVFSMSFRSITRSPALQISRSNVRMMSDAPDFKTFVQYNVYKGKTAINVKPIAPSFKVTDKSRSIAREGALFFEFAPVGAGPRDYDWTKKATFSMSVNECGEVCRMKEGASAEFLHDPNNNCKSPKKNSYRFRSLLTARCVLVAFNCDSSGRRQGHQEVEVGPHR